MKSKLFLSLLALSLLPTQLCATIVKAEIWQRPNGTRVIVLGTGLQESSAAKQQVTDCLDCLKSLKNPYVLIGNPYSYDESIENAMVIIPAVADMVRKNGISHDVATIFHPKDFESINDDNIMPLAKKFLAEALRLKNTMPASLKRHYTILLASLALTIKQLPSVVQMPSLDFNNSTEGKPHRYDALASIYTMIHEGEFLFSYMLASYVERQAAKESCVLLDESIMDAFAEALKMIGYARITTFGTYTEDAVQEMYEQKRHTHDTHNESSCAEENPIMDAVMNHFALNLKDVFNK